MNSLPATSSSLIEQQCLRFDPKVWEAIGYYVYALRHPGTNRIFYIGKGTGNRCFAHIDEARTNQRNTPKLRIIRSIQRSGREVGIDIVRHGLNETTAYEVESALIDALGLVHKGNHVVGRGVERGMCPASEIQVRYGADPLESAEPLLLLKINRQYRPGMTVDEVYRCARWCWHLNINRAMKVDYVLAVANGIVRGVFRPKKFRTVSRRRARAEGNPKLEGRVYFDGDSVDSPYLYASTREFGRPGQAAPVRYINV